MSYYLEIDGEQIDQIANIRGYGDLIRWVQSLPLDDTPSLQHLVEHGWSEDAPGVLSQVRVALRNNPPAAADVLKTAANLEQLLGAAPNAKQVGITDGFVEDDGTDDGDDYDE